MFYGIFSFQATIIVVSVCCIWALDTSHFLLLVYLQLCQKPENLENLFVYVQHICYCLSKPANNMLR